MRAIEQYPNLVTMFFARAKEMGDLPFLWRKTVDGWKSLSWTEVALQVAGLAAALKAQGLKPGDPVMLVSENRPEFCIAILPRRYRQECGSGDEIHHRWLRARVLHPLPRA